MDQMSLVVMSWKLKLKKRETDELFRGVAVVFHRVFQQVLHVYLLHQHRVNSISSHIM